MSHREPHLEDGLCVCSCEDCGGLVDACRCRDCNRDVCGLHTEPKSLTDEMEAFAAHLAERGLTSCGPMVAVREYLTWKEAADGSVELVKPTSNADGNVEVVVDGGETVRVIINDNLKMTPKKLAAQAVHAALYAYGIPHGRVVVLGGSKTKVEAMPVVVRDAGVTELEAGSVTAGARVERT